MDESRVGREPDRRHGQIILAGLDRGDHHPIERHEHEDHEQADHQEARDAIAQAAGAELPGGAPRCYHVASARSRRRTSTMMTTDSRIRNIQLPAVAIDKWNCWKPIW